MISITISQIISACDALRPNRFEPGLKIKWLSELDGRLYLELFKTHENCPIAHFAPYESSRCSLLVPAPYAGELYTSYLFSCMDRENGEMNRYNQSAAQYNAVYSQFFNFWNRENKPLSAGEFKLRGEEKCQVSPL